MPANDRVPLRSIGPSPSDQRPRQNSISRCLGTGERRSFSQTFRSQRAPVSAFSLSGLVAFVPASVAPALLRPLCPARCVPPALSARCVPPARCVPQALSRPLCAPLCLVSLFARSPPRVAFCPISPPSGLHCSLRRRLARPVTPLWGPSASAGQRSPNARPRLRYPRQHQSCPPTARPPIAERRMRRCCFKPFWSVFARGSAGLSCTASSSR